MITLILVVFLLVALVYVLPMPPQFKPWAYALVFIVALLWVLQGGLPHISIG